MLMLSVVDVVVVVFDVVTVVVWVVVLCLFENTSDINPAKTCNLAFFEDPRERRQLTM